MLVNEWAETVRGVLNLRAKTIHDYKRLYKRHSPALRLPYLISNSLKFTSPVNVSIAVRRITKGFSQGKYFRPLKLIALTVRRGASFAFNPTYEKEELS